MHRLSQDVVRLAGPPATQQFALIQIMLQPLHRPTIMLYVPREQVQVSQLYYEASRVMRLPLNRFWLSGAARLDNWPEELTLTAGSRLSTIGRLPAGASLSERPQEPSPKSTSASSSGSRPDP